jgi:membrane fusion protein, multidrug efflux system
MRRFLRPALVIVVPVLSLALLSAACGASGESATPPAATAGASSGAVQLAAENVTTASLGRVSAGPVISGQLTPAREASVRAMVGGSLVTLTVDRGQAVQNGAVIARISSRDLDSAKQSAEAGVKSAEVALNVAKSEAVRTEALVKGGALATRELEQTQNAIAGAEAQLAAARSRVRSVEQALDDTAVKAPFTGVVSARPASPGDVVSPGTELVTIVDPSSMRLEALVPSDQLASIKPGAKVTFTIRGVPGEFIGRVDRFNPTADPVTRQVAVFITLPNTKGQLISGLFAEGRIETASHEGIVIPLSAVDETGVRPTVTRVKGGKAERVPVTLGARQPDTEMVEITSGITTGDVLIVGSAKNVTAGTPITVLK